MTYEERHALVRIIGFLIFLLGIADWVLWFFYSINIYGELGIDLPNWVFRFSALFFIIWGWTWMTYDPLKDD
mgnify:CR=1 FL=1